MLCCHRTEWLQGKRTAVQAALMVVSEYFPKRAGLLMVVLVRVGSPPFAASFCAQAKKKPKQNWHYPNEAQFWSMKPYWNACWSSWEP